jgi:RimJ/RimL family protein N-acetyltransferase
MRVLSSMRPGKTSVVPMSVDGLKGPVVHTRRLVLRRWTDADRDAFARINADPDVMRYRHHPLSRQESDEFFDANEAEFDDHGFGQWAVERRQDRRLIGFIGLEQADADAPFRPLVHIGWHLARDVWGNGYATEGAGAVLDFAFDRLRLTEVVAHTTALNERSRAVMRRLGMTHDSRDDFDAPWYSAGHPMRRFVLYRVTVQHWRTRPRTA